jgi:hypothetical protein
MTVRLTATASDFVLDEARGIRTSTVTWRFLNGKRDRQGKPAFTTLERRVELLLPSGHDPARRYRAVYVLSACGKLDPCLDVIRQLGAHDRHQVICVAPELGGWYGNSRSDPENRRADYLMQVVVPLLESRHATVPGPDGRLLLGFSKSGWGALSLILLNPDSFGFAASWDAPLSWSTEKMNGQFGSGMQYGSLENYQHHHPVLAARRNPEPFRQRKRLVVLGRSFWKKDNLLYHTVLDELGILHHFDDELRFPHDWHPGWVGPALEALVGLADAPSASAPDAPRATQQEGTVP